jgi:hypothetical protein
MRNLKLFSASAVILRGNRHHIKLCSVAAPSHQL